MLSKTLIAAAFGAVTLVGASLSVAPASAAPVGTATAPMAQTSDGLVEQAQYYRGPRRHYGPPRGYRPRCFYSNRRVWNGWRWVVRPVRVCR